MATINPTGVWVEKGVHKTTWDGLTASGDTVGAQGGAALPDKTVYITGTMNSAVVTIKGSNNTATGPYVPLVDPQGNSIAFTATTQIETILENPLHIKPFVSGATGGTDVDVIMISRGS